MTIELNDWRLSTPKDYLRGRTLVRKPYRPPRPDWDHDHCSFCWAKFMEPGAPETLHEGYATEDEACWVCAECFDDFRELFGWAVKSWSSGNISP